MNVENNREEQLFRDALARPAGPERKGFLDGACGNDPALRQRLDALLHAHENPDSALESGAGILPASPAATIKLSFPDEESPGTRIGRYKLLQQIGEGGMGVVYMAEQEEPVRRRVALKIIKLGMDTRQVVARFEAERQALAMMDHPHIAKVLDGGATETGRPYFVMELVQGVPITEFCDKNKLSAAERLKLFIPVCHAIQSAHQKGIIHRDLKPSNVLVTLNHGEAVPMVIDFGIAKATNQKLTEKTLFTNYGVMIGTPAYMSPEQAEMSSLDVDTRADVYSLGVLLYELLTGSTPFPEKRLRSLAFGEVQRVIMEEEPQRPSTRLSTLSGEERTAVLKSRGEDLGELGRLLRGDLDWIVMKCLEKDRRRRYETANGLANDIQRHLESEPVAARPPSTAYRLQKAWRRHRLAFAAGAVVAVALVAGIGISTWQAVVASRARMKAIAAQKEAERAQGAEKQARLRADAQKEEAAHNLYVANMSLAQQAWEENNMGRLCQVLEDTENSPYRGFEWYYWQEQTHLALHTLRGHLEPVLAVAVSPDGQRIVTGSADETAKVWDTSSGRELLALRGHTDWVRAAAFSPDGQRIVTGSSDETARVWEAATGRQLLVLKGHSSEINSAAYSPDGQRIVTGSSDETAKIWDAASGQALLTLKGHSGQVNAVAYSPDGERIITGSWDETAKIWDTASGRELLTLKGHSEGVSSVAYSPDGQRIITGSGDKTAKVWEAASGRELLTLKGHSGEVWSVAYSADGKQVLTGSSDQTAKMWEAASGRELLTLKGHSDEVFSVAYSPHGQRLVTGSRDKTAKVWEVASGLSVDKTGGKPLTIEGHTNSVLAVAFSPDGQRIATGSEDETARVWEAASGRELLTLKGQIEAHSSIAFSPDGQRIVTGSGDKTAKVWDAASGRELLTLKGHGMASSVAFSPDGQRIVTGSFDKTAKVWEAATGRELLTLKGHTDMILSVAFSPDGHRIVTGSVDKTAKMWEVATGRELLTLKGHSSWVRSVAFSPDGHRIVTGSFDKTAKVWEAASGRELLTLRRDGGRINSLAFSPDGQRIAASSSDGTAKVWEAASGRELLTLKGHTGEVYSVAFSPDGQRIATGSADNTAKVWEMARTEQVAAWKQEELAAAQTIAARRREWTSDKERQRIAREHDSIKQWLVLAPIAISQSQSAAQAVDLEQIEGEGELRPKVGEARTIAGSELKWRQVVSEDPEIDFNLVLGQETTQSLSYAVCYLRAGVEQRGLQMLVGGDTQAKIYLNGNPVYRAPPPSITVQLQHHVPDIDLKAGVNALVFKVAAGSYGWKGSICLTDAQGNPVKGITVTLDPEAKEKPEAKKP